MPERSAGGSEGVWTPAGAVLGARSSWGRIARRSSERTPDEKVELVTGAGRAIAIASASANAVRRPIGGAPTQSFSPMRRDG